MFIHNIFPQFIAGPIVKYDQVINQFNDIRRFNYGNFYIGFSIFLVGLFKKCVIADNLSPIVNDLYSLNNYEINNLDSSFVWLASISYSFQLYFDFSGYSDMATGLARVFGIRLPINFNSPYKSITLAEFWRNWHISLHNFLKKYLYIPLGGKYKRPILNLFITMILGGVWHGAGFTFLLWGFAHFCMLIIEKKIFEIKKSKNIYFKILWWILLLIFINCTWVIFRSNDIGQSFIILQKLFDMSSFGQGLSNIFIAKYKSILFIYVLFLFCLILPNTSQIFKRYNINLKEEKLKFKNPLKELFPSYPTFYLVLSIIVFSVAFLIALPNNLLGMNENFIIYKILNLTRFSTFNLILFVFFFILNLYLLNKFKLTYNSILNAVNWKNNNYQMFYLIFIFLICLKFIVDGNTEFLYFNF